MKISDLEEALKNGAKIRLPRWPTGVYIWLPDKEPGKYCFGMRFITDREAVNVWDPLFFEYDNWQLYVESKHGERKVDAVRGKTAPGIEIKSKKRWWSK